MQQLKEHLSKNEAWSAEHEGIWLDFCLQSLTGGFSENRASLVRQVCALVFLSEIPKCFFTSGVYEIG